MRKRNIPEEVEDFEGVWRRLVNRFAYHWEWRTEDVERYFLDRAVTALSRAIFFEKGSKAEKKEG